MPTHPDLYQPWHFNRAKSWTLRGWKLFKIKSYYTLDERKLLFAYTNANYLPVFFHHPSKESYKHLLEVYFAHPHFWKDPPTFDWQEMAQERNFSCCQLPPGKLLSTLPTWPIFASAVFTGFPEPLPIPRPSQ